jgi:hypothetical protein
MTEWSFQAPSHHRGGGGSASFNHPAFYTLSESFFASEAKKESRLEGALFGAIVALAIWPMVLAVQAAVALMQ